MSDFGPIIDRFPDELPPIPQMIMELKQMQFVALETVASDIPPEHSQLMLGPGDYAFPLMLHSTIEDDITVCQVVDLAEHMLEFPDWENRVRKDWVLCKWASHNDHEREEYLTWHLGWFERGRLVPCPDEDKAKEIQDLIVESGKHHDGGLQPPEWMTKLYGQQMARIRQQKPENVGDPVKCGLCGEEERVYLHGSNILKLSANCVYVTRDGKKVIKNIGVPNFNREVEAHLHCGACGGRQVLDDEDYIVE